jgi:LacI family transcriptional regulator
MQLGMDAGKVARYVEKNPADAWMVLAGSKEVLTWFAGQSFPSYAIFGRRRSVPMPSVGPEKVTAVETAVDRLVEYGHRRIVMLTREERRRPSPGYLEAAFLDRLASHGIKPSAYHLPDWQDNPDSFHECLEQLFRHTPPTAILLDEPQFFIATQQHLANRGLIAPRDVSLLCSDTHPLFNWCQPKVSHISWEEEPIIRHATRWVVQLGKGKKIRPSPVFTPASFVEGGTIGPVPEL